ncbi:MAG: carbohydrate kinase, partial [Chitinophagales bacterium]|nr:carbohydrate kinase [Chitinophagales bacterium]
NNSSFNTQHSTLENPDVCGAGDAVIAVASLGLVCGFTLEQIAELSNKAGFIVCQKENVQPVTFEELL